MDRAFKVYLVACFTYLVGASTYLVLQEREKEAEKAEAKRQSELELERIKLRYQEQWNNFRKITTPEYDRIVWVDQEPKRKWWKR